MLIKIQKLSNNPLVIIPLFVIFTFFSCSKESYGPVQPSSSSRNTASGMKMGDVLDGESIFRGIFFLEGNLINEKLPFLSDAKATFDLAKQNSPETRAFWDNMSRDIVQNIKQVDPTYFDRFKEKLSSDNMADVEGALAEASDRIFVAGLGSQKYKSLFGLGQNLIDNPADAELLRTIDGSTEEGRAQIIEIIKRNTPNGNGTQGCVAVAVAFSIALAVYTAIAVANVIAAATVFVYAGLVLWTKTKVWTGAERTGLTDTSREIFVAQISDAF